MAKYHVLGIGYDYDYYSLATAKWTNYDIEFDFADSFAQAKALLSIKDYLCIASFLTNNFDNYIMYIKGKGVFEFIAQGLSFLFYCEGGRI